MERYETYKDSGIEWLGEIPEDWKMRPIKYSFLIQKGKKPEVLLDESSEFSKIYMSMEVLRGNPKKVFYVDKSENKIIETKEGQILLLWDGSNAGEFLKSKEGVLSSTMAIIKPINIESNFAWYYFKSFESLLKDNCTGMGIPHVDGNFFRNCKFLNPTKEEQTQIANYLDQKTTQIDELISKKEQLIQLLEEERTAIINQAVTKGLNPDAPMKDSGIDWLSDIPMHWSIKRLRYVGNCQNGISEGAEFFGEGYPFVSYSDVFYNRTLPLKVDGLAKSNEKHWRNYSVIEGDVFFTRTSETIEEIGIASVCQRNIDKATFAGFLIRFRPYPNTLMSGFSKYYFRCFIPRIFFVKEMNLVTRASLSQELLKRLPVLLPSLKEQVLIAEYLDEKVEQIESVITKTKTEMLLLKEYKTTLISDVVTGKIDVRNEVLN